MSTKVTRTMKMSDAVQLRSAMGKASGVTLVEQDNKENFMAFKYACGRNYDLLQPLVKALAQDKEAIDSEKDDEFDLFAKLQLDLANEFRVLGPDEDAANPERLSMDKIQLDPAREHEFKTRHNELEEQYSAAVARQEDRNARAKALLDRDVIVTLYPFSFTRLPLGLTGTYMSIITPMLTDLPIPAE